MPVILDFVDKLAKVHRRRCRERKKAKYSFAKGILYRGKPPYNYWGTSYWRNISNRYGLINYIYSMIQYTF